MAEEIAFEKIYAQAGDDLSEIPWATLRPMPELVSWLDRQAPAAGQTALVVACGLGDDAEEVSRRGFRVTAFDLVPAAIASPVLKPPPSSRSSMLPAHVHRMPVSAWNATSAIPPGLISDGLVPRAIPRPVSNWAN